jgi:hypothetical protein
LERCGFNRRNGDRGGCGGCAGKQFEPGPFNSSSPMPIPCGKFSTTSANPRSRRESLLRAGHRCGRPQELRSKLAMTLNGICRRSLYRSSNSISVSPGDEQFFPRRGEVCAPGLACAGFWRWRDKFKPWERAKCKICHGSDDENRIGEGMWGEVC